MSCCVPRGANAVSRQYRDAGGELPVFGSIDAANELIGATIMGLWNRLTRHQDRNAPFRLPLECTVQSRSTCTKPVAVAPGRALGGLAGHPRCWMHGCAPGAGGPEGERNGNYRHGLHTKETQTRLRAMRDLRREVKELTRKLQGGMRSGNKPAGTR